MAPCIGFWEGRPCDESVLKECYMQFPSVLYGNVNVVGCAPALCAFTSSENYTLGWPLEIQ